nr:hypothetical protein [Enterococcus cecorum]
MSTKKEMLGKENRKEKGHRRYSLLLLALLFIGFASYGTYAYFTSSASTQHGHLTLNGSSGKYDFSNTDENGNIEAKSGDGLAGVDTPVYHSAEENKEGSFSEDGKDNIHAFGEFDWVYIGNAGTDFSNVYETALAQTNTWQFNNKVFFENEKPGVFKSVTGGDVFRKTVRLQVKGSGTQEANVSVDWKGDKVDLTNISARMNVKIGKESAYKSAYQDLTANETSTILGAAKGTGSNTLVAKAGDTIEITLVAYVSNKDLSIEGTDQLLGQILRNLTISLAQNRDLADK